MAEKVLFSIKGLHSLSDIADGEPEEIEVMNVAEYYFKNQTHYIVYEEIMDGTSGTTRNLLKIKPDSVEISRKGEVNTRMYFETGKCDQTTYYTAEGQIHMGMDTHRVSVTEEENEIRVQIFYSMLVNYQPMAECELFLKINRTQQQEESASSLACHE